jgi:DNA polymerase III epsilon subunit-like protein
MSAYKDGRMVDVQNIQISLPEYVVTPSALDINKIDLIKLSKEGLAPKLVEMSFIEFINKNFTEKPMLGGHNISFDKSFIKEFFDKYCMFDINKIISHRQLDTASLLILLKDLGLYTGKISSESAFDYFGIEVTNRHRALDDCIATVKLYDKIVNLLGGKSE